MDRLSILSSRAFFAISSLVFLSAGFFLIWRGAFWFGPPVFVHGLFLGLYAWARGGDAAAKAFFQSFQLAAIVSAVLCLFLLTMDATLTGEQPLIVDFTPLYAGASLLWQDPGSLYDVASQLEAERAATGLDMEMASYLPFAYPPFVALLFLPFSALGFVLAYQIFTVANLVVLSWTLCLVVGRLRMDPVQLRVLILLAAAWLPVYIGLVQGQTSFLIVLILSLFFFDLKEGRQVRAGLWAGLLTIKPQVVLVPLLILVRLRKWRGVAATTVVILLLGIVSLSLVGWSGLQDNWSLVRRMGVGDEPTAEPLNMYNLRAIAVFLGLGDLTWIAASGAVVLVVLWCFGTGDFLLAGAAALLAIMLCSPHTNPHDAILWVPMLAMLLARRQKPVGFGALLGLLVLSFVPALTFLLWAAVGTRIPVMPFFFLLVWAFCVRWCLSPYPSARTVGGDLP